MNNIEIRQIFNVAVWKWNIISETCGICKNNIMDPCITCQSNEKKDCIHITGACNHTYHAHCMLDWLKRRHVCPLDNQPWSG